MGITTIEAIGAKYAPPGAANDPHGTNGLYCISNKICDANGRPYF